MLFRSVAELAGAITDAAALLDPAVVILDGEARHLAVVTPALTRMIDEVAPGPQVVAAELGEMAALVGAVRLATTLAYEGSRKP